MTKNVLADETLVELYRDTQAPDCFEMLYNRYVGKVYNKCLSITRDADVAEDFTQDIFIKVLGSIDTFQHRSRFSTWLYAISHHYCLDQLRIGKRMVREDVSEEELAQLPDADRQDMLEERLSDLARLAEEIPQSEIHLLQLKYEHNLSIKEIAQQCGLSESAVKMRLKRTRDRLYDRYMQLNA
ncbi:RNA polymerase sigma factor [Spirosoma rhododendri]|uniref:RNA polymerase sigma factor n=1 Tax=Spirosoma rhododendri TaxID=2728024 RepID=A0A7L5DNN9_9BACT|nr:RNA polymerase sigma factor [Spirosoma rhododendri]QJD80016.1 RNA polymerase sigma factor [Spirosoma rhododendri]